MREEELKKAVQSISFEQDNRERIMEKLRCPQKERIKNMKMPKKRLLIAAVIAAMTLGVTALAASGIFSSWYASSSSEPEYTSLPDKERCRKDVGFDPVLIDHFSNGYTFKEGNVVNNRLEDKGGNTAESFKSLDFTYTKGTADEDLYFSQERYESSMPPQGCLAGKAGGISLYYYSYNDKFVPADYQMTAEDKEAEKKGDLVFSFGSDKVEIINIRSLSWSDGPMHYELMQMGGNLSEADLVSMAREVIGK